VADPSGRPRVEECSVNALTAQTLNDHYAAISTDPKHTATTATPSISDVKVFHMLDRLRPTATGLDCIPAWFLCLGAPVFAAPIAELFNRSTAAAIVQRQWKAAKITTRLKVTKPVQPSDFRPISITPVISRLFERYIIKSYIYPELHQPPPCLCFSDQFTFWPTGSTTAALVALLHTVCLELSTNAYVHIFALEFSKAFDSVRHATLMEKMEQLSIPDQIYTWIMDFFHRHSHCTKFAGSISELADIMVSITQGSTVGLAAYLVTAANLRHIHDTSSVCQDHLLLACMVWSLYHS